MFAYKSCWEYYENRTTKLIEKTNLIIGEAPFEECYIRITMTEQHGLREAARLSLWQPQFPHRTMSSFSSNFQLPFSKMTSKEPRLCETMLGKEFPSTLTN